jgi:crotonobetainyl-CoA:carnitine CoA-transferase CaiB-like acyl-CoA transferase
VPLEQPGLGTLPYPRLPGIGPWSVPAPALGEHTAEVLAEFGVGAEELAALRAKGAV